MKPIVTLTLNPSIDEHLEVEEVVPIHKLRASDGKFYPGGGGINVSRVIGELGGATIAVLTAGWMTGQFLRELVEEHGLLTRVIPVEDRTRVCVMIYERCSGQEFRVIPPGPVLKDAEWEKFLAAGTSYETDYIVATGSLPRGAPSDFYARVAARARETGARLILDSSGRPLFEGLKEGVYLVKPNLRELENLLGKKAPTQEQREALCREVIDRGWAEIVALSLGEDGAMLVTGDRALYLTSPPVEVKSTVGAGDSFTAGITLGLAQGYSLDDAFALGLACGTATVASAGTALCNRAGVEAMFEKITGRPLPGAAAAG